MAAAILLAFASLTPRAADALPDGSVGTSCTACHEQRLMAAPEDVTAQANDLLVTVAWTDPLPRRATGYQVLRATQPGLGDAAVVATIFAGYPNTTAMRSTSDTVGGPGTYYYAVRGTNANPTDPGALSAAAAVTIDAPPDLRPEFESRGGYRAYLAGNPGLLPLGVCDEEAAFAHWRDFGRAEGRGFNWGSLRSDLPGAALDPSYAVQGGFTWRYRGGNTVVFITVDAPKPAGWAGSALLLQRCASFSLGPAYFAAEYAAANPGLAGAVSALPSFASVTDHYVKYGFKEGRFISRSWSAATYQAWDEAAYFALNGDVAAYFQQAASDGWVVRPKASFAHWVNFGRWTGRRSGQPLSDAWIEDFSASGGAWAYLAANRDLPALGVCDDASAFANWRDSGRLTGRSFDAGRPRSDLAGGAPDPAYTIAGGFAWLHPDGRTEVWITADAPKPSGWAGSNPLLRRCDVFDLDRGFAAAGYAAANPGLAQAVAAVPVFASLTDHYVKYGFREGRITSTDWTQAQYGAWSDAAYFAANPDVGTYFANVAAAGWVLAPKPGFAHWLAFGRWQGRDDGQP